MPKYWVMGLLLMLIILPAPAPGGVGAARAMSMALHDAAIKAGRGRLYYMLMVLRQNLMTNMKLWPLKMFLVNILAN